MHKFFSILAVLLLLFSCKTSQPVQQAATVKEANTLLWEVSGKELKAPSFLFGTFHMMCQEDVHFSENLINAIKDAESVYFEIDLDDMAGSLKSLVDINMDGDKTLKDILTAEQYGKVEKYFKDSLHTSLSAVHKMKPLFLLSLMYPKFMDCKKRTGVEQEIMKVAKSYKKEINGLESLAFQASLFDSIPYSLQANELVNAIDSMQEYKKNFQVMLDVYKSQDLSGIEKMFTKVEFGMEENMDMLLYDRNRNWVKQLTTIMHKNNVIVAVGAGHLPGDNGLIGLLRKEGYQVKPVDNEK